MHARKARPFGQQVHPFVSAKTVAAIPVRSAAVFDALVLSTLDPVVKSIGHVDVSSPKATVGIVFVELDGATFYLDIEADRNALDTETGRLVSSALHDLGGPTLTVSDRDLYQGPRYHNALEVWRYRHLPVRLTTRLAVLRVLQEGPLNVAELSQLVGAADNSLGSVFSLACADVIEIDLVTVPLGPKALVRKRRVFSSDNR
jgi:hypothetical protein